MTLDVYRLLRTGMLVPGEAMGGTIRFERSGTIGYQGLLRENGTGGVRLMWVERGHDGDRQQRECWVMLRATPQPFGGMRWWFVCPISGRIVLKVHKPGWSTRFASRTALGLAYASQNEDAAGRARRKAYGLRERLGDPGRIGDALQKPKWMRWQTFYRERARVQAADAQSLTAMMTVAMAMSARLAVGG